MGSYCTVQRTRAPAPSVSVAGVAEAEPSSTHWLGMGGLAGPRHVFSQSCVGERSSGLSLAHAECALRQAALLISFWSGRCCLFGSSHTDVGSSVAGKLDGMRLPPGRL